MTRRLHVVLIFISVPRYGYILVITNVVVTLPHTAAIPRTFLNLFCGHLGIIVSAETVKKHLLGSIRTLDDVTRFDLGIDNIDRPVSVALGQLLIVIYPRRAI